MATATSAPSSRRSVSSLHVVLASGTSIRAPATAFESVPSADAYVMKNVIHDWPDDKAIAILGAIKAAAPPGAKLLLLEMVVPDHDREFLGHYADMEMLVLAGALERGLKQWTDLLRRGGFRMQRVVQTAGPLCVIEAVPG
jgi:hypothetical protein